MRVFGTIILGLLGGLSVVFALLGFFAHSLVDFAWMHITGIASEIAGKNVASAMEAGSQNVSLWPSILLAIFGIVVLISAFLLGVSGNRVRRVSRGSPLAHQPPGYDSSLSRTSIRRRSRR